MSASPPSDTDPVVLALPPRWQRALPPPAALVAGFAALCCLGLTALVSLLTAIGATFLTQDATLRPLLAVSLVGPSSPARSPGAATATLCRCCSPWSRQ